MRIALAACVTIALSAPAAAEQKIVLRMASPAPDGTAWAREARAFARDVENLTHGTVGIKYYLGGITGDEFETAERIRRGQLDGIASSGMLCQKLAPSMRVLRVLGLFQNRDESAYISGRLRSVFDEELRHAGFINVGELGIGPDVIFSRTPIRSMAELRQTRLWIWDLDEMYKLQLAAIGMKVVATPIEKAGRHYEQGALDGFIAVPTAALAFQWSAQVKNVTDLRVGFLRGCFLFSARSFDQLPSSAQEALRVAHAKLLARLEDLGRAQDQALLDGLFEKQGVKRGDPPSSFRAEFFDATRQMRERLGKQLVPDALLTRVLSMLADYRAEHGSGTSNR
jgi:TRAP-type C4-dicarboxylate transport system substrate-binding protein